VGTQGDVTPAAPQIADGLSGEAVYEAEVTAQQRQSVIDFRRHTDVFLLLDFFGLHESLPAQLSLEHLGLINLPLGPDLQLQTFTTDSLSSLMWCAADPSERMRMPNLAVQMCICSKCTASLTAVPLTGHQQ
jgi:hypothetical protein